MSSRREKRLTMVDRIILLEHELLRRQMWVHHYGRDVRLGPVSHEPAFERCNALSCSDVRRLLPNSFWGTYELGREVHDELLRGGRRR